MDVEYFTSESVTKGHPDKLCDQVADAVLDDILKKDPLSYVACEVTATTGLIHVMGEISTNCYVDISAVARETVNGIGYNNTESCFNGNSCAVITSINAQSADIAMGVDKSLEYKNDSNCALLDRVGAGDQGIMYGYACKDTSTLMPAPIFLAHRITKELSNLRETGVLDYLRPDGKSQVTVAYENGIPKEVTKIVISAQHDENVSINTIKNDLIDLIVHSEKVIPSSIISDDIEILINPTGRFVVGGPAADSGLTGRKLMVDTYGGMAHHGGGAFSGKDPTKVDRSGSYMARYVAKNIVGANLADKCEVSVSYAIGIAQPVCVYVNSFGTSRYSNAKLTSAVEKVFDFRPKAIIDNFDLRKPIYKELAAYGHFGREDLNAPGKSWIRLENYWTQLKPT